MIGERKRLAGKLQDKRNATVRQDSLSDVPSEHCMVGMFKGRKHSVDAHGR